MEEKNVFAVFASLGYKEYFSTFDGRQNPQFISVTEDLLPLIV